MKGLSGLFHFLSFALLTSASAIDLIGDNTVSQPEHLIQRSDAQGIVVDWIFPGITAEEMTFNSEHYSLLKIEGEGESGNVGAPQVPVITRLFAIPDDKRVVIEKIIPVYKTYSGIVPFPLQPPEYYDSETLGNLIFSDKYYQEGGFFPEKWVTLSEPAIYRDYRIVPVNINPIRIDAATGEAQVLTSLHLELSFDNGPTVNVKTRHFDKTVSGFAQVYSQSIANYDWINPNGEYVKGSLLIVYPQVTNVLTNLQPLIEWKIRSGYKTTAVGVPNNCSVDRVKDLIQNAYQTYDPPLEAVILIGDCSGSLDINCYTLTSGASDHYYTMLEGDDILNEIVIGRYSVSSITELTTAVNKVLYYETEPSSTVTGWYKKGGLASGSGLGYTTIVTNKTIKSWWLEDGFNSVDTLWFNMGGSFVTFMTNCFNNGVSAFNYCGYFGASGWSTTNIFSLVNTGKLPFTIFCIEGSGNFNSSASACLSEAWLRAGSPTNHIGGIGGVGTATTSVHAHFNHCVAMGIWNALHSEGLTTLGQMTFRGKLDIYLNYQNFPSAIPQYFHWNNLMGDPTTDLWTEVPQILAVEHSDSIPAGTTSFTVMVQDTNGIPLPGRYVTLWKGTETYTGGTTDETGIFTAAIDVPTSGDLLVTVTHHNDRPYLATVPVYTAEVYPSYFSLVVDDDNLGASLGNGDGEANPLEVLELSVTLKNFGVTSPATNVSAVLSTDDDNVTITSPNVTYPDIAVGATVAGNGSFAAALASEFNDSYVVPFMLTVNSTEGTFVSAFDLEVVSGQCRIISAEASGNTFEPGQTDEFTLTLRNDGGLDLSGITGILTSADPQVTVIDSIGNFGAIAAGATGNNSANTFSVAADLYATYGRKVNFTLHLQAGGGEQQLEFEYQIGPFTPDNPIGPDSYGYYCLDNTDLDYSYHPVYNWIEINPEMGGPGRELTLPDYGNDQDCSICFDLPFNFQFYGEDFEQLTVCSNGWLAFGDQSYFTGFCNYTIPSPGGAANGMLCPYWDNLKLPQGAVYCYDDTINHLVIVEFYRMNFNSTISSGFNTFEVILYDPEFYPTPTGDGEIEFQYNLFSVSGYSNEETAYWTTGIENHQHTDGILYSYYNVPSPGAAAMQVGRAIKFTTQEPLRSAQPATVEITLEPLNPPIQISAMGDSFQYTLQLNNVGTQTTMFDTWIMVTLPNSSVIGPALLRPNITFAAGETLLRTLTQNVPGIAMPGEYIYTAKAGDYTMNAVWDSASFNFTKLGVDASAGGDWRITGWEEDFVSNAVIPLRYELGNAYPNPFNPVTEISFALPHSGYVILAVYNTLGQKAADLQGGRLEAGWHSVTFDGSQLSSGVYFYTLQAGGFVMTKKMVLMK